MVEGMHLRQERNSQMNMKRLLTATALLLACNVASAVEVSLETARMAAAGWIVDSCGAAPHADSSAATYRTADGNNAYHVVQFGGGGYVIMSGDDRMEPVLAYCEKGEWGEPRADSPIAALLSADLANRVDAMPEASDVASGKSGGRRLLAAEAQSCEIDQHAARWRALEAKGRAISGARSVRLRSTSPSGGSSPGAATGGLSSLADIRRRPFVTSEWGQGNAPGGFLGFKSYPCFNLYVPGEYPCGCAATAMAQTMRYWKWPTASVAKSQVICRLDGKKYYFEMKGGKYDWEEMPLSWMITTYEAERKAMGKLTYDCAVSVGTSFGSKGSSLSDIGRIADAFKSKFKYAHATYRGFSKNAAIANMDASAPVVLTIYEKAKNGSQDGHAVVLDGYGYDSSGALYFHMNPGWDGSYMLWYNANPPVKLAGSTYVLFDKMVCNVFPKGKNGSLLTGRVTSASGGVSSGVFVSLYDAKGKFLSETKSDSSGIYSFRVAGNRSYSARARGGSKRSPMRKVTVAMAKSGVNLTLQEAIPQRTVTFDATGGIVEGAGKHARSVYEESKVGTLPSATKVGHSFKGWYTSKSGGTKVVDSTRVTKDVVYYARWKVNKYKVLVAKIGKGTVSGVGTKAYKSKVKLAAKAAKGYVFVGWFDGDVQKSRSAKYVFKMPAHAVNLTAKFATTAEDKAGIWLSVGGAGGFGALAEPGNAAFPTITNVCGVAIEPVPVISGGITPTSVSVTGLPRGLKYDAKKKVVAGVPSEAKTFTAKLTVKSRGASRAWTVKWVVVPMPTFAKGVFNGWTAKLGDGEDGGLRMEVSRKVMVGMAGNGAMSAKVGTLSFSRTGWSIDQEGRYVAKMRTVRVVGKGKSAKKYTDVLSLVLDPDVGWAQDQLVGTVGTFNGDVSIAGSADLVPINVDTIVTARRNSFEDSEEAKELAAVVKGVVAFSLKDVEEGDGDAYDLVPGGSAFTVTANANGSVVLAGRIGKEKVTSSATLAASPDGATALFFCDKRLIEVVYTLVDDVVMSISGRMWEN